MARVGATDRVPAGREAAIEKDPHAEVLRRAGFDYGGRFEFSVQQTWTVESLTGFAYSTSFLNHEALGDRLVAFERDLADRLAPYEAEGTFGLVAGYAYDLARRLG